MLTGLYITLRFGHFISLMLAFGCVLYGAWWAPVPLRRVLMLRFYPLLRPLLLIGAISTLALYLLQGGIMGEGWIYTSGKAVHPASVSDLRLSPQ